jgi:hypothetical protein
MDVKGWLDGDSSGSISSAPMSGGVVFRVEWILIL